MLANNGRVCGAEGSSTSLCVVFDDRCDFGPDVSPATDARRDIEGASTPLYLLLGTPRDASRDTGFRLGS